MIEAAGGIFMLIRGIASFVVNEASMYHSLNSGDIFLSNVNVKSMTDPQILVS